MITVCYKSYLVQYMNKIAIEGIHRVLRMKHFIYTTTLTMFGKGEAEKLFNLLEWYVTKAGKTSSNLVVALTKINNSNNINKFKMIMC